MSKIESVVLFCFSVFISVFSQVLLKKSAMNVYSSNIKEYLNRYVITAYFIFLLSTITTTIAYREIHFKYGSIIQSSGYVWMVFLNYLFWGKRAKPKSMLGIAFILIGIIIFSF